MLWGQKRVFRERPFDFVPNPEQERKMSCSAKHLLCALMLNVILRTVQRRKLNLRYIKTPNTKWHCLDVIETESESMFLWHQLVVYWQSHVWLFVTPWTACQAFLCFTVSWSWLKLIPIESVMPSNHLILCHLLLLLGHIFPSWIIVVLIIYLILIFTVFLSTLWLFFPWSF